MKHKDIDYFRRKLIGSLPLVDTSQTIAFAGGNNIVTVQPQQGDHGS